MRILEGLVQGSPQWLAVRAKHNTASEAPVVMGASKYQTRAELLHQKHTGITRDVDHHTQALFDRGHATEAAARALVEEDIGEPLFPATATDDDGYLLASLDGITMTETILFEHKLWGEALAAQVRAGELEPHYFWQLEQELLVSGAEKVIFVCSDGTRENFVSMEYRPVPGRAQELIAAWRQFDADLAAYVPAAAEAPAAVGKTPETLPALRIEVTGMVTASNLAAYKEHALAVIGSINRNLQTDQDFADAAKAVKWCHDVKDRLVAAKDHALSQTESIDALFKAIDEIVATADTTRLELDKLVKARKEARKGEIVAAGVAALADHLKALNERLGKPYMPAMRPEFCDFGGAIRGKSSFANMKDAVDGLLAKAKIEANRIGDLIDVNLKHLREHAKDHAFLFADTAQLVLKDADYVQAIVAQRIQEHKAAEQKKADDLAEAAREAIRKEEAARADREARERLAREQEQAQQAAEAAKPAPTPAPAPSAAPVASSTAAAPNVVQMRAAPAAATVDQAATIRLGQVNERLHPIALTAEGLHLLGFEVVSTEKGAKLYRLADLPLMVKALHEHLDQVQTQLAA